MTSKRFDEIADLILMDHGDPSVSFNERARRLGVQPEELREFERLARLAHGPAEPRKYSLFD